MSHSCHEALVGPFGAVQVCACDQAVLIDTISRSYDTAGYLHVEHCCLRLPLREAYRLEQLLSQAIVTAETSKLRQPGFWSNTTNVSDGARMSPARIGERLTEAIAQLDETYGFILHPTDAAAIARVAADLAGLKLAIEMAQLR
jgi:hypothetical protein